MPFRIVLDREGEEFVERMLESGRYEDASDVIVGALRLLKDHEQLGDLKRAELLAKLDEGLASAERGEGVDADDVFDRLIAKYGNQAKDAAE